jgi:hypothetical protein
MMKTTKALSFGLAALTLAAVLAGPSAAHHAFTAFNTTTQKTTTGVVNKVDWTNPHIWIWMDVANEKGGKDVFGFEGMSPNYLERRGWTRTTLKAGDKITVTYRPLRDGNNGGMWMTGTMESGKVLTMGGGQ